MSEPGDDPGFGAIVLRAGALAKRLSELTVEQSDTKAWIGMWAGVGAVVMRLAKTLFALAMQLKDAAVSAEPIPELDDDVRDAVASDLRDIADEFPDLADVLFGLGHLDRLWDAIMSDDDAREKAASLLSALSAVVDQFIDSVFDIVLGERESSFAPGDVINFLQRYEDIAQNLLDRWLQPALDRR